MLGDAVIIIHVQTGIGYELFPVQVDSSRDINLVTAAEKAELDKLIKLTA